MFKNKNNPAPQGGDFHVLTQEDVNSIESEELSAMVQQEWEASLPPLPLGHSLRHLEWESIDASQAADAAWEACEAVSSNPDTGWGAAIEKWVPLANKSQAAWRDLVRAREAELKTQGEVFQAWAGGE